MGNFSDGFFHPVEDELAEESRGTVRNFERQTIPRLRYVVCRQFPELEPHLESTAHLSLELANALDLDPQQKEEIWYAGSVHDLGKSGINPLILAKADKLSDIEFTEIQDHTVFGHKLFAGIDGEIYKTCAEVALSHHERWDGTGYPSGIRGDQIPLAARIVAIADVYDCIVSGRPYQPPQSAEAAIAEIVRCSGTQFDPDLVKVFSETVHPR